MTRMKDSGIEWIGEVPEEWGIVRLKDCLEINNGKDYKDIETDETGYPVIGSGGQFAYARKYLHDGTAILLGRKGTIDKPLYIEGKFWTVDTMFYGVPKSGIHAKFIYYVALQIPFGLYSTNTALPSMTQTDLQNHHFVMPPLDEQTQIADFLDKKVAQLNKAKNLLEEQIKTLEDYRQSLIYETVTKGLDKTVPLKDSGVDWIGQIPEGWGVSRMKYLTTKIGSGKTPLGGAEVFQTEGILFIRSQNVFDGRLVLEEKSTYIDLQTHNSMISTEVMEQDILFNITGASIGRVSIYNFVQKANVNQHVAIIRGSERVRPTYLMYYLMSCIGKFQVALNQVGGNREGLTFEQLKQFIIAFPTREEQTEIADFLDKKTEQINQMIAIKKEQIENINKQRQTLIYDYVTGKRRV
ncbi:TPA: restriction endonuclease subunit S [Streptococcus suis]